MSSYIPFDWLEFRDWEAQLRFVARILTPNGRKRFAKSIPIFPNPIMNTYMSKENSIYLRKMIIGYVMIVNSIDDTEFH